MQVGLVGLGRMGSGMRERLTAAGHQVVGYDPHAPGSDVTALGELVDRLDPPRTVWLVVPPAAVGELVDELDTQLTDGDVVIDGGNTHYVEAAPRARRLARRGIGFLDVGVSGGVWGREYGYALMIGGDPAHVSRCMPLFTALAPGDGLGLVHAGGPGAGHFAKMVHNGVEYGMMQAYAEGFALLTRSGTVDDVAGVVRSWRSGTVVRSWLLDLLDRALEEDPELRGVRGVAEDTGTGRWLVAEAAKLGVPVPATAAALFARFTSQEEDSPAMRVVAALREQFGGHAVRPAR